jgi:hypothetical protein
MDAYDGCTNLGKKNLADSVDIYGRGRELFRPPTYILFNKVPKKIFGFREIKNKDIYKIP